jgi:hypothetical protein
MFAKTLIEINELQAALEMEVDVNFATKVLSTVLSEVSITIRNTTFNTLSVEDCKNTLEAFFQCRFQGKPPLLDQAKNYLLVERGGGKARVSDSEEALESSDRKKARRADGGGPSGKPHSGSKMVCLRWLCHYLTPSGGLGDCNKGVACKYRHTPLVFFEKQSVIRALHAYWRNAKSVTEAHKTLVLTGIEATYNTSLSDAREEEARKRNRVL